MMDATQAAGGLSLLGNFDAVARDIELYNWIDTRYYTRYTIHAIWTTFSNLGTSRQCKAERNTPHG